MKRKIEKSNSQFSNSHFQITSIKMETRTNNKNKTYRIQWEVK